MANVVLKIDSSSLPTQKWLGDDYLVQLGDFWYLPQLIKPIQNVINHFNPLPTDVILASSPKTGTTWLKSLLHSILNRSSKELLAVKTPHNLVPFLEGQVFSNSDDILPSSPISPSDYRRLLATHISYQLLSKTLDSCECKVVYVTRNPKDTLVSMWHFTNGRKEAKRPWALDDAVELFCKGLTPFGPYYDHVIGYRELSLKRPEHMMFVTYEEMKVDPHGHVKKLGEFLGCPFQEEDEVDEIVKNCSFEVLSSHEINKSEECIKGFLAPNNAFFRKGKIGDHKNYLSDEATQQIDALTKEKFHSLGFMYGI